MPGGTTKGKCCKGVAGMRTDNNWIQTYTGRQFWPTNPRSEDVCIEDIAHALSMKCRYTGHCKRFYSVAEHSVLVAEILPDAAKLWGLMHDAAEAYMPDVARPIKREISVLLEMDNRITIAIAEAFGLSLPMPAEVHDADLVLLATERRDLMALPPRPWISTERVMPLAREIIGVAPPMAKELFLKSWLTLTARSIDVE